MPTEAKPIARKPILIDLALQGGGSHGAFTWGVLDRFLEEPWLEIDGISGTSAGAMNAAVLVYGHQKGGAAEPERRLKLSGGASRTPPVTVRSSAGRSTCCSGAGRSILRRCMSRWISCRAWCRPTTSIRWARTRYVRSLLS